MSGQIIRQLGGKTVVDLGNGRVRVFTENKEPSRTQGQWKDTTDVNNIMKKYRSYNHVPFVGVSGSFKDVSEVPDYQTVLNQKIKAENAFMKMSSDVRNHFDNDINKMISFLADPKNKEEAIKLGLVNAPKAVPPNELLDTLKEVAKNTAPKKKPVVDE